MLKLLNKCECDGSTVIEFAFVAPLVVALVTAVIEFGMAMFVGVLMESGLRDASRYGITGGQIGTMTRMERIAEIVSEHTIGLVDMAAADIDVLVYPGFSSVGQGEDYVDGNANGVYDLGESFSDGNANGIWDADIGVPGAGGSGDIVLYRISYDWPMLTPLATLYAGADGVLELRASIVVRNEPWEAGS